MNYNEIIHEEGTNMFHHYFSEFERELAEGEVNFKEHVKGLKLKSKIWTYLSIMKLI